MPGGGKCLIIWSCIALKLALAWCVEIAPAATLRAFVVVSNGRDNDCIRRYFGVFPAPGDRPPAAISATLRELLITAGIALIILPAARTLNKSLVIERFAAAT